jgi:hypothetical protein
MSVSKPIRVAIVPVVLLCALVISPSALAGKKLQGRWQLTITIPEGPNSDKSRVFPVTVDVSPRGDSLQGRLTIADEGGRTVGGVWRQTGKKISIAYELPCSPADQCGSLVLLGKIKEGGVKIKGGTVIVMWDTPNDRNHALYDTSNGSFSGERLD